MESGENRRTGRICAWCAAALGLALLAVMASMTLWSADDLLYATFLDGSLHDYLSLLLWHYQEFNGRVIVHVAAQIILNFGSWCFLLVCLLVSVSIPLSAGLASGLERRRWPTALFIFLCGIAAIPPAVLCQGYFWISAFCNYVLPTAMVCIYLALAENTGSWRSWALPLFALACGAATEQTGAAAVVLALYFVVKAFIRRRDRLISLLSLALSGAGLASVFLSPATQKRLNREVHIKSLSELIDKLITELDPAAEEFNSTVLVALLLMAFFLLTGRLLRRKLDKRWPMYAGAALAVLPVVSFFLAGTARAWIYAVMCVAAAVCAAALIWSGREAPALMALTGLVTLGVILMTESAGERTLVPFCLYLLAAVAVLTGELDLGRRWSVALPAAAAVLAAVCAVPLITGMVSNYKIELENRHNIARAREEGGALYYRIDYDLDYTWTKCDYSFTGEFLQDCGLPRDTRIHFYSRTGPNAIAGGVPHFPVLETDDGPLITIRVVEELGATLEEVNNDYTTLRITAPWRQVYMTSSGEYSTFTWTEDGQERTMTVPRLVVNNRTYFPIDVYTEAFGLTVTADLDGTDYYIDVADQ